MIELVGWEIRLNGERVGVFTGTPADRMKFDDALREDARRVDEEHVAAILRDVDDQARALQSAVSDLDEDDETRLEIEGVVEALKEIDA